MQIPKIFKKEFREEVCTVCGSKTYVKKGKTIYKDKIVCVDHGHEFLLTAKFKR